MASTGGLSIATSGVSENVPIRLTTPIRAYREVGHADILCHDDVPAFDFDLARECFFTFSLGYNRELLQVT